MKNTYEAREEFKKLLFGYRSDSGLTVRELAEKAHLSQSLISSFEQGENQVGSETAEKLADALELKGTKRSEFLLLAAATKRRDRLVAYARNLPASILNAIPLMLKEAHIDLDNIIGCQYNAKVSEVGNADHDRLVIELRDGRKVICNLSLVAS